jgi:hypothetical protein
MRNLTAMVLLALVAAAGCTGSSTQGTPNPTPAPTLGAASPIVTAAPTPTVPPAPSVFEPVLSGDATTNPACELATSMEISAQVEAGVREIRGLTSPGAYGKTGLSCAWYLDSTDIGIPSVVVQWEFPVTTWHDPVV